ncbi:A24 family peptidase [Candidatus Uhrbacteria bacterium]|nr:A24 family peptidase [Candidatus Uhrbacteria bacterium]
MEYAVMLAFLVYLFALAWYDWKKKLLPVEPMIAATIVGFLFQTLDGDAVSSAIGILVGVGFIWIQVAISKGKWMGRGDIWFAASIGAFLGWPGIGVVLYLTYIVGGVIAVVLFATGIYRRGMRIPFAPFLAIGTVGAMLWGNQIADWFTRGFGIG